MGRNSTPAKGRQEPWFGQGPRPAGRNSDMRAVRDEAASDRVKGKVDVKSSKRRAKPPAKRRSLLGRLFYWGFVMGVWGFIGLGGIVAFYAARLPPIDQLAVPKRPPNIAILASDGSLLANRGDSGGAAVRINELPPYLPAAFVAIEDRRFYSHFGIDPYGIARAILRDVAGRGGLEGGSTLTQQLAKNLFLTQERSLSRKVQEAILALWLEHKYSKDRILELYLNRVYFGSGAYGVEAAAQKYFGHSARDVSLSESAVLAGLMKAPTRLAPDHNPGAAATRAALVITAMAQSGKITEAMAQVALAHPAKVVRDKNGSDINYVADYVMDVLSDQVGAIDHDIVVDTTINPSLQRVAESAVSGEIASKGGKLGVSQGALVAMQLDGAIVSLVGGRSYADSQFNRATSAKRQPGSSFKPFVYLTALEGGLTPDSIRDDSPVNIKGWKPSDFERRFEGPVSLRRALSTSINTVAVRLGQEFGPQNVVSTAQRLGVLSPLQPNASIALGTSEVTPLELVSAYVPFANGGIGVLPHIIKDVHTTDGKFLYRFRGQTLGRVIQPEQVAMMNDMMMQTVQSGTARKAQLAGWQAAGKTGTSQNFRDAWFVGYTSHLVTGVWLGNDDNTPTHKVTGGSLPAEVWHDFMVAAHRNVQVAALPTGSWHSSAAALAPPAEVGGEPQDRAIFTARPPTKPGAPMTINQAAAVAENQSLGSPDQLSQKDRGMLEKLLGQ